MRQGLYLIKVILSESQLQFPSKLICFTFLRVFLISKFNKVLLKLKEVFKNSVFKLACNNKLKLYKTLEFKKIYAC